MDQVEFKAAQPAVIFQYIYITHNIYIFIKNSKFPNNTENNLNFENIWELYFPFFKSNIFCSQQNMRISAEFDNLMPP